MLKEGLPQQAIRYLQQVLGSEAVRVKADVSQAGLPYFLQDAYEVVPSEVLGQKVTLACFKGSQAPSAQQMDRHVRQLHELLHAPVIVALSQVTPGERRKLIEQGLAFLVPDRQLYAPRLGVILSEQFPVAPKRESAQVSPATQALLIWFLLHHPVTDLWHPSVDAATMGYTAMTATRAVRELLAHKLFELEVQGRAKYLKMAVTHRQLWEKAKPHLTTPVQRTLWTYDQRILRMPDARAAGESALALRSTLNDPSAPVLAVTAEHVSQAKRDGVFFEPHEVGDAIAVQVWRYLPTMESDNRTADRLSVWLSLRDSTDPRIWLALDEIERQFPW